MKLLVLLVLVAHVLGLNTQPVGLILLGRNDVDISAYGALTNAIQAAVSTNYNFMAQIAVVSDTASIPAAIANLTALGVHDFFLVGHSMTEGGILIQNYALSSDIKIKGVILIASFLQRIHRPDIVECLKKASIQPVITWTHPLGVLPEGAHDCHGHNIPNYPIPTLTIGGELDGVVRLARIAEAYYTQVELGNATNLPVVVIPSMNHASLLNTIYIPKVVTQKDLRAELPNEQVRKQVGNVVSYFIGQQLGLDNGAVLSKLVSSTGQFLQNINIFFSIVEGNWFFTGSDEEHGYSVWGAQAQTGMARPLPQNFPWNNDNQFHLLSDEESIPPYYRSKHRADVILDSNRILSSTTISQLRFIELSIEDVDAGLNGWGIIKEEKLNILKVLPDDGSVFVSAIEIATKIVSRQKVFNITGNDSPDSLDSGNRCAVINQQAYNWALERLSQQQRTRWDKYGIPFVMGNDIAPFPDAGPFWIWKYLEFNPGKGIVTVAAPYAFYSLSADPYGAGNHYCKLLSPARALEWMLTDGLRENYGLINKY